MKVTVVRIDALSAKGATGAPVPGAKRSDCGVCWEIDHEELATELERTGERMTVMAMGGQLVFVKVPPEHWAAFARKAGA